MKDFLFFKTLNIYAIDMLIEAISTTRAFEPCLLDKHNPHPEVKH